MHRVSDLNTFWTLTEQQAAGWLCMWVARATVESAALTGAHDITHTHFHRMPLWKAIHRTSQYKDTNRRAEGVCKVVHADTCVLA
jgi:hypothetical protein